MRSLANLWIQTGRLCGIGRRIDARSDPARERQAAPSPTNSREEKDEMPPILAGPSRSVSQPPDPSSRVDGCPECVLNTEAPAWVDVRLGGQVTAYYECADCGHRWFTSWQVA